jgi:hypothetical protein
MCVCVHTCVVIWVHETGSYFRVNADSPITELVLLRYVESSIYLLYLDNVLLTRYERIMNEKFHLLSNRNILL